MGESLLPGGQSSVSLHSFSKCCPRAHVRAALSVLFCSIVAVVFTHALVSGKSGPAHAAVAAQSGRAEQTGFPSHGMVYDDSWVKSSRESWPPLNGRGQASKEGGATPILYRAASAPSRSPTFALTIFRRLYMSTQFLLKCCTMAAHV